MKFETDTGSLVSTEKKVFQVRVHILRLHTLQLYFFCFELSDIIYDSERKPNVRGTNRLFPSNIVIVFDEVPTVPVEISVKVI